MPKSSDIKSVITPKKIPISETPNYSLKLKKNPICVINCESYLKPKKASVCVITGGGVDSEFMSETDRLYLEQFIKILPGIETALDKIETLVDDCKSK